MAYKQDKNIVAFRNIAIAVIILSVVGIVALRISDSKRPIDDGAIATLAQCLSDKGVKMYGAEWCSHCQDQKKAFGDAWPLIDYVECGVPGDPRGQAEECEKDGVSTYPTWQFSLGHRETGKLSFVELAFNAGCPWGEVADTNPVELEASTIKIDTSDLDSENIKVEQLPLERSGIRPFSGRVVLITRANGVQSESEEAREAPSRGLRRIKRHSMKRRRCQRVEPLWSERVRGRDCPR